MTLPHLPGEILACAFSFLSLNDLKSCLIVCRQWSAEAHRQLHRHARLSFHTPSLALAALTTHRRYIQSVDWEEGRNYFSPARAIPESNVLHLLLDCLPPEPPIQTFQSISALALINQIKDYRWIRQSSASTTHVLLPGPDRPTLKSFRFKGLLDHLFYFPDALYCFQSLTRLDLECFEYTRCGEWNAIALDRILLSMPELTFLAINYCSLPAIPESSPLFDPTQPPLKLRHFQFQMTALLNVQHHQAVFTRLSNLVGIRISNSDSVGWSPERFMTGYHARTLAENLRRWCPLIEKVHYDGPVPLPLTYTSVSLQAQDDPQVERELWTAFPNLFSFISSSGPYPISAQDLAFLGHSDRLTVLDLRVSLVMTLTGDPPRHQRPITSLQLQKCLENCRHLRSVRSIGTRLEWLDMIPEGAPMSAFRALTHHEAIFRYAIPWACEETLESLVLSFAISSGDPIDHRIIYGQLGRLKRLKHLSFVVNSLVPTMRYGMELLAGLDRLETITWKASLWPWPDKETVQWLATHFSRLEALWVVMRRNSAVADEIEEWLTSVEKLSILKTSLY